MKVTGVFLRLCAGIFLCNSSLSAATYVEGDARIFKLQETIELNGPIFEKIYDSLDVEPIEVSGCHPTSESGGCVDPFLIKIVQKEAFACIKPLDARTQFGCFGRADFTTDIKFAPDGARLDLSRMLSKKSIKKIRAALIAAYGQASIKTEDGTGELICESKNNCFMNVTLPRIGCNGIEAPKLNIIDSSLLVKGVDAKLFFDNLDLPIQNRSGIEVKGFNIGGAIFECSKSGQVYSCLFDDKGSYLDTYASIDFSSEIKKMPELRTALEDLNSKIANRGFDPHRFYQNSSKNFSFQCDTYLNDSLVCKISMDAYAFCVL
ncbi:MAG: hypothetical protein AB7T49_19340 [Oligoflexales bacterium]